MKSEWWIVFDKNGYPCKVREVAENAEEWRAHLDDQAPLYSPHRVVRVVPVDEILATLKDPANVHQMMLRGAIAPIGWRLTCHLTGEVPNGEDVQLAEIVRLREEVKALRAELQNFEADSACEDRCERLEAEVEALRADAERLRIDCAILRDSAKDVIAWCDANPPAGDALYCIHRLRYAIAATDPKP